MKKTSGYTDSENKCNLKKKLISREKKRFCDVKINIYDIQIILKQNYQIMEILQKNNR